MMSIVNEIEYPNLRLIDNHIYCKFITSKIIFIIFKSIFYYKIYYTIYNTFNEYNIIYMIYYI